MGTRNIRIDMDAVGHATSGDLLVGALHLEPVVVLAAGATLADAATAMVGAGTSAVFAADAEGVEALVTERDLVRALADGGATTLLAVEVATAEPVTANSASRVVDAVALMLGRGFRHVPVVDPQGDIVGILGLAAGLEALLAPAGAPPWLSALRVALHIHGAGGNTAIRAGSSSEGARQR